MVSSSYSSTSSQPKFELKEQIKSLVKTEFEKSVQSVCSEEEQKKIPSLSEGYAEYVAKSVVEKVENPARDKKLEILYNHEKQNIFNQEEMLFTSWAKFLNVSMDEFVSDGLLFHDGLMFDGANWVRTLPGNNSDNWINSSRRLLIITRDQPSDDGDIWDVRGETGLSRDGNSLKRVNLFKCLIPWSYAILNYDNNSKGICPDDDESNLRFWAQAPIARMNSGKIAGNRVKKGGCPREKVKEYLQQSKSFVLKQIQIYDANFIMCCSGYDTTTNPIIDFLQEFYLTDLVKVNDYLWYSASTRKSVFDTYHFSNWSMQSNQAIADESKKIRDSIINAKRQGCEIV